MDSTDTVDNLLMAQDLIASDNFVPRSGGTALARPSERCSEVLNPAKSDALDSWA